MPHNKIITSLKTFGLLPLILLLSTACATTWIKRKPNTPSSKPAQTLLVGSVVKTDIEDVNLLDLAQNAQIEKFGSASSKKLTGVMADQGFTLVTDKLRSRQLDSATFTSGKVATALTGYWQHPEASRVSPQLLRGELGDFSEKMAERLGQDGSEQYYASTEVTIKQSTGFGVGGIKLWAYPTVVVEMVVVDGKGRRVFDARGTGSGDGSPFVPNRSAGNLSKALDQALEEMLAVEAQTI